MTGRRCAATVPAKPDPSRTWVAPRHRRPSPDDAAGSSVVPEASNSSKVAVSERISARTFSISPWIELRSWVIDGAHFQPFAQGIGRVRSSNYGGTDDISVVLRRVPTHYRSAQLIHQHPAACLDHHRDLADALSRRAGRQGNGAGPGNGASPRLQTALCGRPVSASSVIGLPLRRSGVRCLPLGCAPAAPASASIRPRLGAWGGAATPRQGGSRERPNLARCAELPGT
jgi:hypothetical protein